MAPEVLQWLRADVALTPGSDAWKALGVVFTGGGTSQHGWAGGLPAWLNEARLSHDM